MKCTSAIRSLCGLSFITASATYEHTYSFPPTNTTEFIHGLCVLGALSATAFSTMPYDLNYTAVSDFKNGVTLWDDRLYTAKGVEGDEMCKGGIYLKPSMYRTIDRNTGITLKAISIDGNNISIYAFLVDAMDTNNECGSEERFQSDYRGMIAETGSGLECQRWDSQNPHGHSRTAENFPDSGLEENYCRNPDNEPDGTWCYTTDINKRWRSCNVPVCPKLAPNGTAPSDSFSGDWAEFLLSDGFEVSNYFQFATAAEGMFVGFWRSYYKTLVVQLPAKLYLPAPNCTTSDSAIGVVTCRFTEIICPDNVTQSVKILDYECETDYNSTTYGNTSVVESSTSSTCGSDVSGFDAMAEVNYKSGHEGDVNFCIKTELIEGGEIMYYRSERVKMTFEYDGEFLVTSFNTSEYEGISKDATVATKSFGVEAEICNESGNISTGSSALAIGDNLFVCIKTKDEGTRITAITNITAEKATDTSTGTEKLVIDDSKSNVVVTGLGSEKLMVVINFPARFFTNRNVIVLKGNVEVKGTKSRRLLSPRALQEATPDVTSDDATFGLVIDVVAELSSATGHNMMVAALLGVPALLLV